MTSFMDMYRTYFQLLETTDHAGKIKPIIREELNCLVHQIQRQKAGIISELMENATRTLKVAFEPLLLTLVSRLVPCGSQRGARCSTSCEPRSTLWTSMLTACRVWMRYATPGGSPRKSHSREQGPVT